ncbi:hypothetical protein QT196_14225 [Streptomyces sp. P9-2B-2]|uniref:hypothetical protein n=1 Tax=Streptomyces sp. P9-2B-2 TaxID=3057114 RepID=UPI0025B4BDA5|nr:hypothetical protein [Streptomyces sp. P9-2B-2]WJY38354.1 hypothetical protein QT196_14225 [Streptomyces sp. P9-2B-2]
MRTISTIRWVNGVGALIPARTATAPEPDRSGGDLSLPIPVPGEESARISAAGPAPASGTALPAPHRVHAPHDTGSAQATRRRTPTADSPPGRRPLPVRGESARCFRTLVPAGAIPVPGAGGRPVTAAPGVRGDRPEFPGTGGHIAGIGSMDSPISASPDGTFLLRGMSRSLGNGSVTMTAARVTGTCPAAFLAAEIQ